MRVLKGNHAVVGLVLGLSLVPSSGCGKKGPARPQTLPVTGRVVYASGAPVEGGMIQFAPVKGATVSITGDILRDGSFVLNTLRDNQRVPGAPAGEYKVTVTVRSSSQTVTPVTLMEPVKIGAQGSEMLRIELPRMPGRS